jgi:hypothetical protein
MDLGTNQKLLNILSERSADENEGIGTMGTDFLTNQFNN